MTAWRRKTWKFCEHFFAFFVLEQKSCPKFFSEKFTAWPIDVVVYKYRKIFLLEIGEIVRYLPNQKKQKPIERVNTVFLPCRVFL